MWVGERRIEFFSSFLTSCAAFQAVHDTPRTMQSPAIVCGSVRRSASQSTCPLFVSQHIMSSFFQQVRTQDQSAPVTLILNEDSLTLSPDQYRGKTVSQLFAEYGSSLGGDVSRINRYVLNGEIVAGDTVVRPGETVRGSVSSESKGLV